jgi:hypothetical protein
MMSRSFGILVASWLPCLALMLPLSPFHTVNAIVAGLAAVALSALSLAYERARMGAALVGVWVALTPFVFQSSFTGNVLAVCWGVTMFVTQCGPFSQKPRSTFVRAARRHEEQIAEDDVVRAAA